MQILEMQKKIKELGDSVEKVPWENKKVYGAFLAQTYYYVLHSTRILASAAGRFGFEAETIHKRFIKHAAEEMNHEHLATRDIKNLGFKLEDFPEFASTRAFYQVHYQTIEHTSPWSVMGYIAMIEGLAVDRGSWLYEKVKNAHGEKTGGFMKIHAAEDVEHVHEVEKILLALPEHEQANVLRHFETSCFLYRSILAEATAFGSSQKTAKNAA